MAKETGARRPRAPAGARPIMRLLDLLGRRWTLRIPYELRDEAKSFRRLRGDCEEVSPSVLIARLGDLREASLVELREGEGYALTALGRELGADLLELDAFAKRWVRLSG